MTVSSEGGQWTSFVPLTAMHWSSWRKMKILWHFERKQQFDLLVKCNKIPLCFSLKTYMLANMCATCNFPMKTYSTTSVLDSTDFNLFFLHFFCYIVFFFPGVYFLVSAKTIHAHVLQGTNWLFELLTQHKVVWRQKPLPPWMGHQSITQLMLRNKKQVSV